MIANSGKIVDGKKIPPNMMLEGGYETRTIGILNLPRGLNGRSTLP